MPRHFFSLKCQFQSCVITIPASNELQHTSISTFVSLSLLPSSLPCFSLLLFSFSLDRNSGLGQHDQVPTCQRQCRVGED